MDADPNVQAAERRIEDAKASLISRFEQLGRKFQDAKRSVDMKAQIGDHPLPAVGIAFAVGALIALAGGRRSGGGSELAPKRGVGGAVVAAIGAIAFRAVKELAIGQLADVAKTYFVDKQGAREPGSVEPFLEH